jgi:integrase
LGPAGGLRHFSPHSLRGTFAGDLFEAGHDIAKIMRAGGWATPTQCAAYDRRGDQGRREMASTVDV